MSEQYLIGESRRIVGVFKNIAGTMVDPSTVTMKYQKPRSSTVTTLVYGVDAALVRHSGTLTDPATGITYNGASGGLYYVDLVPGAGEDGTWSWRWVSTGTPAQAEEGSFDVADSPFD